MFTKISEFIKPILRGKDKVPIVEAEPVRRIGDEEIKKKETWRGKKRKKEDRQEEEYKEFEDDVMVLSIGAVKSLLLKEFDIEPEKESKTKNLIEERAKEIGAYTRLEDKNRQHYGQAEQRLIEGNQELNLLLEKLDFLEKHGVATIALRKGKNLRKMINKQVENIKSGK